MNKQQKAKLADLAAVLRDGKDLVDQIQGEELGKLNAPIPRKPENRPAYAEAVENLCVVKDELESTIFAIHQTLKNQGMSCQQV